MTWVAVAVAAIGAVVSAVGIRQQGKQQKKIAEFKAKEIQNQRANDQLETAEAIKRQRIQNRKQLALQRAGQIKSGFSSDAGSPLEQLAESAVNQELAIQDEARAGEVRSRKFSTQAALSIFEGEAADKSSKIAAGATLLQGASQAGSIFAASKGPSAKTPSAK